MNSTIIPDGCLLAPEQSLSNSCPSSEWESIREYLALLGHTLPVKYQEIYEDAFSLPYIVLSGKESQRKMYVAESSSVDPREAPHYSTTQMVATADALYTTGALWFQSLRNVTPKSGHGSPLSVQSDSIHTLSGDSFQGFTLCLCMSEAIQTTPDTDLIAFPFLSGVNNPATPTVNKTSADNYTFSAIIHPSLSRTDLFANASHPFEYQLQWIDLPQPLFNGSSIGAIKLPPQAISDKDGPHNLTLCNFAAGWGTTTLQTDQSDAGGDNSVSSEVVSESTVLLPDSSQHHADAISEHADAVVNFMYPEYPQLMINITQEWAQYLDPMVESANRSVFDLLMQEHLVVQGSQSVAAFDGFATRALALMLTNGLARIGYESTLQGSPRTIPGSSFIDGNYWLSGKGNVFTVDPVESKDWVKFHVNSTLQGYAYNTQTLPPRLAIGVMTLYCIIALAHVIYSGITGKFSPISDTSNIFPILLS